MSQSARAPSTTLDIDTLLHWVQRVHAEDATPRVLTDLAEFLSRALDGGFVSIQSFTVHPETMGKSVSSACDSRFQIHDFYPDGIPWLEELLSRPGQLLLVKDLITEQEVRASAFYRDFMRPQGFLPTEALGSYHPGPTGAPGFGWAVHGVRPLRRAEIEFCKRLDPHLATACMRRAAQQASEHSLRMARQVLDNAPVGVVQIDRSGTIGWMSEAMGRILARCDGLRLVEGTLRTDAPEEQGGMDRLVEAAIQCKASAPPASVTRSAGNRPLGVVLVPGAERSDLPLGETAGSLVVIDPDLHTEPPGPLLEELYGLTPAETRLALAIAEGATTAGFATESERSLETIRTQLKSVFRKLGVRRQADLARVVGMSGALLPMGREATVPPTHRDAQNEG